MWNILNTIAGCVCIYLLVYWVLEFRRARKLLAEMKDIRNDLLSDNNYRLEGVEEKIDEHSLMIDALRKDMNKAATKTDLLANSVEYWGTNPASLPLKEHKQLIKDVAQIKSELEAITVIVNRVWLSGERGIRI